MKRINNKTLNIALIALFSAMLTGGKYILSFIPNIEVISLIILVIASVFGIKICLPVTLIFCILEPLLYGFGTWVVTYFLYWNLFGLASSLFFCKKQFKSIYPAIFTAISTLIFGVLSTTVDVIFAGFGGVPIKSLLQLFSIYYIRGIGFFVTHIISNFLIVFFLYTRLYILLSSMNNKLFFAVTKEKV